MRDSFLRMLAGETVSEAVWCADVTYWVDGNVGAGKADASLQTEQGLLQLCAELGCMPYFWYGKFWAAETVYDGVEVDRRAGNGGTTTVWRTSVGELRGESTFSEDSWSESFVKYPVETEEDLKVFLLLLECRTLRPANLDDYSARLELWARYDGVPILGMPRSPLPALVTEWAGAANASVLLLERPELCAEVLSVMEAQEAPVVDAICELAPPVVHFPDNQTSDVYTPFFDTHMAACYRNRLERLHDAGVRCAVHLDGSVRGLLPKLTGAGFDAIEALTPAPAGDADVAELRRLAGSESVVLWGGVPGVLFAPPYTWEDVRAHVERTLESCAGEPFILGVGDQVPPNGDLDFCRRISDVVRNWRG